MVSDQALDKNLDVRSAWISATRCPDSSENTKLLRMLEPMDVSIARAARSYGGAVTLLLSCIRPCGASR